ncbi:hypothetical protein EJ04DRAFT_4878 [Polyplosphaeria fusca]|uniref:Uncharacterized protein n=1 Tax=Polyplosphaeria fusca TaxID=682080 RepID=A0A9P4R9D1_9PLEO|nr:hypothetical protein EJ04DRAFT_4878 [Polyplosphaeria fusca]
MSTSHCYTQLHTHCTPCTTGLRVQSRKWTLRRTISERPFSKMISSKKWQSWAEERYIFMLLFFAAAAYSAQLVYGLFGIRLINTDAYANVSSFFGPGTYLAWWFTATSLLMKGMVDDPPDGNITYHRKAHWEIGTDFLCTVGYVAAAAIWTIVRTIWQDHAELEACLIVLEAGADLSLMHVAATSTRKFSRVLMSLLVAYGITMHQVQPVAVLVAVALGSSSTTATPTADTLTASSTAPTATPGSTSLTASSASVITTAIHYDSNFRLATGVDLFLVAFLSTVWTIAEFPLKGTLRRRVIALLLAACWIFDNALGNYKIMPRTGTKLLSLDQLASLGGAAIVIGWSWKS